MVKLKSNQLCEVSPGDTWERQYETFRAAVTSTFQLLDASGDGLDEKSSENTRRHAPDSVAIIGRQRQQRNSGKASHTAHGRQTRLLGIARLDLVAFSCANTASRSLLVLKDYRPNLWAVRMDQPYSWRYLSR